MDARLIALDAATGELLWQHLHVLPDEFVDILSRLQDRVPPFATVDVLATFGSNETAFTNVVARDVTLVELPPPDMPAALFARSGLQDVHFALDASSGVTVASAEGQLGKNESQVEAKVTGA